MLLRNRTMMFSVGGGGGGGQSSAPPPISAAPAPLAPIAAKPITSARTRGRVTSTRKAARQTEAQDTANKSRKNRRLGYGT